MSPFPRIIGRLLLLRRLFLVFHWSLGKDCSPYMNCGTVMGERCQR